MKLVVWGLFLLLIVVHQDFWFWTSHEPLAFGFIPAGLAWHAGISLAAGVLWALAVRFAWPVELEAADDAGAESPALPHVRGRRTER